MSAQDVFRIEQIPPGCLKQVVHKMLVLSNYRLRRTCRAMMTFLTENMSQTSIWISDLSLVFEYETRNMIRFERHLNGKCLTWFEAEEGIANTLLLYNNFNVDKIHLKHSKNQMEIYNLPSTVSQYPLLLETFNQTNWNCKSLIYDGPPSIAINFSVALNAKTLEVAISDGADCSPFIRNDFFVDFLYLKVINDRMHEQVVRLFLANDFCRELRTSKLVEHYDFSPLPVKQELVEEITAGFLHTTHLHKKIQFDVLKTDIEEIFLSLTGQVDECPLTVPDSSGKLFYYVYIKRGGYQERTVIKIEDNLEAHKRKERQRTRIRGSTFHVTYFVENVK